MAGSWLRCQPAASARRWLLLYYLVGAASSACFQPPMRRGGRLRGDAPAAASVQSKMVGSPKVTAIGKRTGALPGSESILIT
jgi:hypothetical protein